ncbi:MAG: helix-turn-helix domain-containing protein [Lepagella sp.]
MTIAQRRILDVKHYGNLTIQAIAESVGYRSQSGFVQLFKKATGFTPSMFQKMVREEM